MRTVRFLFDFISPYAYLAWTQMRALGERHGVAIEPQPIVFAALLDAHGTRGPAEVPARRRYLVHDIARIARRFVVPLAPPPAHPFSPIAALRLATVDPALIDPLFRAAWATGEGLAGAAAIASPDVIARATSPEIKAQLRAATDAAIARGVFGAPTMLVDDQLFFGCDSLPHLEHYLAHGDVADPALVATWESLPSSATRKAP